MIIYGATDKGLKRDNNQDCFEYHVLNDSTAFAVLCDGMGGANAGNIASELAVETICRYIKSSYHINLSESAIENILRSAVSSANDQVYSQSLKSPDFKGMGTTVVVAFIKESSAYILHIGDSRAYKFLNNTLEQLTVDHSMVQSLLDSGQISAEEAKVHPKKNIITRALGVGEFVASDFTVCDFENDSAILLCSDGLSNFMQENDIKNELMSLDETVVQRLISGANKGGGGDNITAVVIEN